MEQTNDKEFLEKVEKAAYDGAKAGAGKRRAASSIGAKVGTTLLTKILSVLLIVVVIMAIFPKFNVLYKLKQELGFDKDVSGYDMTIENHGIFGYTAVDFAEAILGDAEQLKKIEVYEREVSDVSTVTDTGLLKLKFFTKCQEIKYTGVATYVVDLKNMSEKNFSVDESNHTVTVKIPHAELKDVNVNDIKCGELDKGVLAFGEIKMTAEQSAEMQAEAGKKIEAKLEAENELAKADEFASKTVWDMYYPAIVKVSPGYSLEIKFQE